jgi:hypothetical protein
LIFPNANDVWLRHELLEDCKLRHMLGRCSFAT